MWARMARLSQPAAIVYIRALAYSRQAMPAIRNATDSTARIAIWSSIAQGSR
jgi:hypothetical protein